MALTRFLLDVQFWFPLWLIFLLHLGFDLTTAVIADGVFRVVSVVAEIPLGMFADRLGRKRTYLLIAGFSALTFAGMALISTTTHLFIVWILWGLLWALNSGAATAYAYELSHALGPRDKDRGFAVIRAAGQLAILVSLVLAGSLYEQNPTWPFWITAALALLAGLLALGLPDIPRHHPPATWRTVRAQVTKSLAPREARGIIMVAALFLFYAWSAQILFQPLAINLALTPTQTGWMYASIAAVGMLASLSIGWVSPRGRPRVVALAFGLTLTACALVFQWPALGPVLWLPMLSLAWSAGWTSLELEVSGRTEARVRATVFSIIACTAGLGIAVARPSLGALSDRYDAATSFGVWALTGLVITGAALALLRRPRGVAQASA